MCNFSFPKSITRPFPGSLEEEEEDVTQVEDLEMAEALTNVEEDLAAQEAVALEDASIPAPEEELGEGEKEASEDVERVELAGLEKAVATTEEKEEGKTEGGGENYEEEKNYEEEENTDEESDEEGEESSEQNWWDLAFSPVGSATESVDLALQNGDGAADGDEISSEADEGDEENSEDDDARITATFVVLIDKE